MQSKIKNTIVTVYCNMAACHAKNANCKSTPFLFLGRPGLGFGRLMKTGWRDQGSANWSVARVP